MVKQELIDNLLEACLGAAQPNSHIPVIVEDFVALVDASGTDDEGFQLAASRLRGCSLDEPLALEAQSLQRLVELAAKSVKSGPKTFE